MEQINTIKALIALAERTFSTNMQLDSGEFDDATAVFIDAIAAEVHKIVLDYGLQHEYFKITENTVFEGIADEWIEKNPFNPESYVFVKAS